MKVARRRRQPPSLSLRICAMLEAVEDHTLHYKTIAARLRCPPRNINRTCVRLVQTGHLRWVDLGIYALREEEREADGRGLRLRRV